MLIEQPHALGRVDGAAAAECDDHVGLELFHPVDPTQNGLDIRIGLDIGIDLGMDRHRAAAEVIQDTRNITEFDHGRVGDDKGACDVRHVLPGTGSNRSQSRSWAEF